MATHAQKARVLYDEFELASGVRPGYPRSRAALGELRETLDRYTTALQDVQAASARRQAEKDLADEFARLGNLPIDNFDLDTPTSAGEPEDATLVRWTKRSHQREGATHVFSSWRYEIPDPYYLGNAGIDDNIRVRSGKIVYD